jgi:hypothetical protein
MFYEKEIYNLPTLFCSKLKQFIRPNMITNIMEILKIDNGIIYNTIVGYYQYY